MNNMKEIICRLRTAEGYCARYGYAREYARVVGDPFGAQRLLSQELSMACLQDWDADRQDAYRALVRQNIAAGLHE